MQSEVTHTVEAIMSKGYMQAEYEQLCTRIHNLTTYIKKNIRNDNLMEIDLKEKQLQAMTQYKNILELRAALNNIDLS